ncbi:MAG: hypothetical protein ABJA49_09245 [Betaproteobacteria bacterium]
MKRMQGVLLIAVTAFALSACGDRTQTIGVSNSKLADTDAWSVSSNDPYVAPGWTPGDKASWEDHLRRRTQMQNDYAPR